MITAVLAPGSPAQAAASAVTTTVNIPSGGPVPLATSVQPDGSLLAVLGYPNQSSPPDMVRIGTDGQLDESFGNGGVAPLGIVVTTRDLLVDPQGRILFGGYAPPSGSPGPQAMERLLLNGSPDPSFGSGGISSFSSTDAAGGWTIPTSLLSAPDGSLYVASSANTGVSYHTGWRGIVTHLLGSGTVDPSYGSAGSIYTTGYAALALRPDGDLVVAGDEDPISSPATFATYDSSGRPVGAPVTFARPGGDSPARYISVDGDGYIVVGGPQQETVARYGASSGSLDRVFSHGCPTPLPLPPNAVPIGNGGFAALETHTFSVEPSASPLPPQVVALLVTDASGALDERVAPGGRIPLPVLAAGDDAVVAGAGYAYAVEPANPQPSSGAAIEVTRVVLPPAGPQGLGGVSAEGIAVVADDGGVFNPAIDNDGQPMPAYAGAFCGSAAAVHVASPVVGISDVPGGFGYWLVASDGGIFSFGDARFFGSTGAMRLNKPVVGMAPTPDGGGYWLVGSDGGIFSFGDARFFGSTGAMRLNRPVVGMAATPDGAGYWLVGSDGGIFSFGDARFFGSTGAMRLNRPVVGMAATPDGGGYWLAASDGGVFTFGDAPFLFSAAAPNTPKSGTAPTVGISGLPGGGYVLASADGQVCMSPPKGPTTGALVSCASVRTGLSHPAVGVSGS